MNATDFHRVEVECDVAAEVAFAYLSDPMRLGEWALGAWDVEEEGGGMVRGRSLFDDSISWIRAVPRPHEGRVDFHIGSTPECLVPRIAARVAPLPGLGPAATRGEGAGRCRVALEAARDGMDDARWLRLVRCHEVEVLLIAARLPRSNHRTA